MTAWKPRRTRDRTWFEQKVAELGRALNHLRPERQDRVQEFFTGEGEHSGEHSEAGGAGRGPGKFDERDIPNS